MAVNSDATFKADGESCPPFTICFTQIPKLHKHMETKEVYSLVDQMYKKYAYVKGWRFSYEYPGFFQLRKPGVSFCFNPDYDKEGEICVQVFNDEGVCIAGEDVPYGESLTVDQLVMLIAPQLEEANYYVHEDDCPF